MKRVISGPVLGLLLFTGAFLISGASAFELSIERNASNLRFQFPSESNAYYIVRAGNDPGTMNAPTAMRLGSGFTAMLEAQGILAAEQKQFFYLERISVENPLDSDLDGINDVLELQLNFMDPLNSNDAGLDFDEDGFSNHDEILAFGTSPETSNVAVLPPRILGLSFQEAKDMLTLAGFQVGTITCIPLVHTPAVAVLAPDLSPFIPIPSNAVIDLTISLPDDPNLFIDEFNLNDTIGSTETSEAYYQAVDPLNERTTLEDWKTVNGFYGPGGTNVFAAYFNEADLGFGRHMHMRWDSATSNLAYYVVNYATADEAARGESNDIATVCMEYSPHPVDGGAPYVKFFTYNGNHTNALKRAHTNDAPGVRMLSINLDGRGEKFQPGMCMTCHGGQPASSLVDGNYPNQGRFGARFIPFDVDSFTYPSDPAYSRANQEDEFKLLNQAILDSIPQPHSGDTVAELIHGWYGGPAMTNAALDEFFIPTGWQTSTESSNLYLEVFAKSCRACHVMQDVYDFPTYADFDELRGRIQSEVFELGRMPMAKRTFDKFWKSTHPSQAQILADWLAEISEVSQTISPAPIPELTGGLKLTQTVFGVTNLITDLDVSFDGSACSREAGDTNNAITHTFVGDLVITLTAPDNATTITLLDRVGGSGTNICNMRLDDEAALSLSGVTASQAPYIGTWKPNNSLSAFDGLDPNGDWVLTVYDEAGADTGSVQNWNLHFNSLGTTTGPGHPVAEIYTIGAVSNGAFIAMAGSRSLFADSYEWSFDAIPEGSSSVISSPTSPSTVFQIDHEGEYRIRLVIRNESGKDEVVHVINVPNLPPSIQTAGSGRARWPSKIIVDVTTQDDGFPADPGEITIDVAYTNSGSGALGHGITYGSFKKVTFSATQPGSYVATITVSDGEQEAQITTNLIFDAAMVSVGDAGNPADPSTGLGAVSNEYSISKFEVTWEHYAEFLSTAALFSDPYELYHPSMASHSEGGIVRTDIGGILFVYDVKPGMHDRPVCFVTILDAMRYVNWLHNMFVSGGAPETETGAYTLLGGTTVPSNIASLTRNPNAQFWIPSENEWYKAAYHQPAAQGGDSDHYWLYATRGNVLPTASAPPGISPAANYNYLLAASTSVGSYTGSPSYYGTFDQTGNMQEFTDTPGPLLGSENSFIARGGSYGSSSPFVDSAFSFSSGVSNLLTSVPDYGFRIAGKTLIDDGNTAPVITLTTNALVFTPTNLTESLPLSVSVTDDGIPTNGTLTIQWGTLSSPAGSSSVTFNPTSGSNTLATFPRHGEYTLSVTASDGSAVASTNLSVNVLVSFTNDIVPLIQANCAGCHTAGGLDFGEFSLGNTCETSYAEVFQRVDLANPTNSLLIRYPAYGSGGTMNPVPGFAPGDEKFELLKTWIEQMAPTECPPSP